MSFDSHLQNVLMVAVRLVNGVVAGESHGRAYPAPEPAALVGVVGESLSTGGRVAPRLTRAQAAVLVGTAADAHRIFTLVDAGELGPAAGAVNDLMGRFGTRPQLDPDDLVPGGGVQLHFHGYDDTLEVGWSAGIAAGLAAVLGSDLAGRTGVCTAPACDRVYVDLSRNNQKRFCSSACQNRVKAAAFRARRAEDAE